MASLPALTNPIMQSSRAAVAAIGRLLAERELLALSASRQFLHTRCSTHQPISLTTFRSVAGAAALQPAWSPLASAPLGPQWSRAFSTGAQGSSAAAAGAEEDALRPRILRLFAFLMICGAGLNVVPHVAAASVGNTLALLDAQQPFMVKAGCSRLQLLMRMEAAREQAAEAGAAGKLLALLRRPELDPGVADYALATLEALAGSDKGLAAVQQADGAEVMQGFLAATGRSPETEDAVFRAQRLVAALGKAAPVAQT